MVASRLGAALVLLLALTTTLPAQETPTSLLQAERRVAQLSSDSGFAHAVRTSWHRDGVLLWPGAPVLSGQRELGQFLRVHRTDSLRLTWQPLGAHVARDSSLGVTWGLAVASSRVAPTPPRLGRYIAVWRQDERRWSIAAVVFMGVESADPQTPWPGLPSSRPPARPVGRGGPFVAADLAFAALARDSGAAVAFRSYAAEDAVSFGGGSLLVRGPLAISQGVAGPAQWKWHPVLSGATAPGDLGWTVGEAIIVDSEQRPNYSKYLTVWIRSADDKVRFLLDGGNARPGKS